MKIVVLDGFTVNPGDLSWGPLQKMGDFTLHERTLDHDIVDRSQSADILVVNKVKVNAQHLEKLSNLKAIFLLATGYDNVDIKAAKNRDIAVYNAVGYGTESVAQHTLALLLSWLNQVEKHDISVKEGTWSGQPDFSYSLISVHELKNKTLGLLGYGRIAQRVAELCKSFGMQIIATSRSPFKDTIADFVTLPDLFKRADVLSLHTPLTSNTRHIINTSALDQMKNNAILLNTARGDLIDEVALLKSIQSGKIQGAALDVLSVEPPPIAHPFFSEKRILITPHMAWRSVEARSQLIKIVAENIHRFLTGDKENRVN